MAMKKVKKKDSGQAKMTDGVRRYELLAIYPLSVNEIAAEKALADICKKAGFVITEVDKWGIKNLAYEIKKESKGYYLRFVLKDGNVGELENAMKIDDKILRYIVIKI